MQGNDRTVNLVRDGKAAAVIVLPAQPSEWERLAADELVLHLKRMSGAEVPVVTAGDAQQSGDTRIVIGRAALDAAPDLNVERALGERDDIMSSRDGFVLRVGAGVVAMCGLPQRYPALPPKGTLYAAYDLLERLGCRWLWPGELGLVIPQRRTVSLEPFESVQTPSFEMRYLCAWGGRNAMDHEELEAWYRRNRINRYYPWSVGHNPDLARLVKDPTDLAYAPQVAEKLVVPKLSEDPDKLWYGLGWKDGYEHVKPAQGLSVRHPWGHMPQASDVMFRLLNQAAEHARDGMPQREYVLGVFAYMNYILPPVSVKPHPDLSVTIAVIEQCPQHVPFSGTCWQRDATMKLAESWAGLCDRVIWFDYEPGFLVAGGVPMPHTTRLRRELPLLHRYGLRGIFTMFQPSWCNVGPNLYLRARLNWDMHADPDAILDDYFTGLFGPAAAGVRAYWDALETLMHAPGVHFHEDESVKSIFPLEKILPLEAHIRAAEAAAQDEPFRTRVATVRFSFDNLVTYLRMREAEDEARFADAAHLGKDLLALREGIRQTYHWAYHLGALNRSDETGPFTAGGWIRQNEQRQAAIDGSGGKLVAMLPDLWQFRPDPHDEGVVFRWFDPDANDAIWRPIRTTRLWDFQGMQDETGHGYHGAAWYRTAADLPADTAGQTLRLNFGGVHGQVLVWINGAFAGHLAQDEPWWLNAYNQSVELDVTAAAQPGRRNEFVIRVDNQSEWGGIFRRVFLYAPAQA